ncbi:MULTISPECIES: type II secretion system F family protein [Haloarcula]|uniref:Type II secretion protein F n=1 Tax=Haloarcula pellucida TaxID=1427151 RepID=A0A830GNK9_9EURY|nr:MULTISPECIES: type II secretion system F family protein [Halomicroarcula]MBX0348059.1 type II secretion system F family protein [Halomicroarcula pellucida]MDS0277904.1 type II secretion system F family protein [Halomicroarcula sp. S1AR25-4]GGN96711.1 type II secretion protein F [Halomicroarcula pellucida]
MSLDTKGQQQLGSGGALGDAFYPAYQTLFDEEGDFVDSVQTKLAEARMADNVEMFLARALAVGVIAGLALWLVGTLLGYLLVSILFTGSEGPTFIGVVIQNETLLAIIDALKLPFLILVTGVVFGAIGFGIGFGSLVSIPYFRASAREREINILLSDSISFMYALSVGGLNQLEILQAMAKADDTYGEVAHEFQSIVLETEYFDTDYRTAVRNQALETPSDSLSQFLTDMLSIINSGGDMTSFLEDQKEKHMRTARQEQEKMLETLELFGEMYMTLSLFPLLLIIILVIMSMMGNAQQRLIYGTVYGLIPLTGMAFLVLVSTVTQDSIGDGYLRPDASEDDIVVDEGIGVFNLGLVEQYSGSYAVFDRVKSREGTYEFLQILKKPHLFFRDHPMLVLGLTIPLSILSIVAAVVLGQAPLSLDGMINRPVPGTFFWVYVPMYINFVPLTIFYEWNQRSRKAIIGNLSDNLRKLASANDTGMTLLESIKVVSETSAGKLSDEFETMHAKVNYGTSLKEALREFNNKYHVPRLARTVKLIAEAQEASSQIQDVLSTAAQASENQDDIERERKSRTRMQMVIIIMTYLTLLGVMALLKTQFLDVMSGLSSQASGASGSGAPGGGFGGSVDVDLLSMLFFHAVTLQALLSSFIAGYIREVNLMAGVKFAVVLSTIALVVWMAVG